MTDLDTVIAKISSDSQKTTEDTMAMKSSETPLKLQISLPIKRSPLMPEINVLPATPQAADVNESAMFIVKNLPSIAQASSPSLTPAKLDSNKECLPEVSVMQVIAEDQYVAKDVGELSKVTPGINDLEESDEMETSIRVSDDSALEENNKKGEERDKNRENLFQKSEEASDRTTNAETESVAKKETVIDTKEEKAEQESENEIPDTNSESSKESFSLRKERKKTRPKSLSEMALNKQREVNQNLDPMLPSFDDRPKTDIKRVNTFHLGSKSMVSIGKHIKCHSTSISSKLSCASRLINK